ncbi:hypothetical protein [Rhodanobacter soli]|uniref:hypothetical protein n=1 Tax=Rhodanobacter soli TaxID=590609 RepID=UPI003CD08F4C
MSILPYPAPAPETNRFGATVFFAPFDASERISPGQRGPVHFHRFETADVFIIRRSPHCEGWSQRCPPLMPSQREAQPAQFSQGDRTMHDQISEGFMVFTSDGAEGIGSVREIRHGLPELLVYIENAGDFVVPLSAVKAVHSDKVILDFDHLGLRLRNAIRHARDSEDPDYVPPASTEEEE